MERTAERTAKKQGEMDAFHGRKEETPDASNAEGSSVSFFIYALSTKMQGILPCSLRVLSYTFTQILGLMLTTLVILVADVLLDVVSRWA